jgi:hypothetical protein
MNLKEKYDKLKNEYDCVQFSWLFCCDESEKCAAIILDLAEKLNINISFNDAYYKQTESLKKIHDIILAKLELSLELLEMPQKILKAVEEQL